MSGDIRSTPEDLRTHIEIQTPANSLTPEEINRLGSQARQFVRNHPEVTARLGEEYHVTSAYYPRELMDMRRELSPDIGKRFDAHGIAKGNYTEQLRFLNNLLSNGVDPNREFHTTALRMTDEEEAGLSGAVGAAGPYEDGSFIVVSNPDHQLREGVSTVLVNENFYSAIPTLQARFPLVNFIKASDMVVKLPQMLNNS